MLVEAVKLAADSVVLGDVITLIVSSFSIRLNMFTRKGEMSSLLVSMLALVCAVLVTVAFSAATTFFDVDSGVWVYDIGGFQCIVFEKFDQFNGRIIIVIARVKGWGVLV